MEQTFSSPPLPSCWVPVGLGLGDGALTGSSKSYTLRHLLSCLLSPSPPCPATEEGSGHQTPEAELLGLGVSGCRQALEEKNASGTPGEPKTL